MLSGAYALYVVILAYLRPHVAPALPPEARTLRGWPLFFRSLRAVLPPVLLIFAVLGSIFQGVATPTEAGTVGAVGALLLAAFNGRLNWKLILDSATATARVTSLVVIILFCASLFSLVFDALGGKAMVTEILVNAPGGYWGFILISNLAVFILGIPLEFTEICFIVMPLFVPAAKALNIDLAWFAIVMAVNLQTAFISPPVGFSLFYLQSTAPKEVSTADIHRSAIPFVVIQLVVLVLVILFPQTVRWLIDAASRVPGT
jgi:tripartite ATP-independent transporter DctM subunit